LLFNMNIWPPIFEHSTPLSYSSFTLYILALNFGSFTMDFHSTHVVSLKKADKSANFAAGRIVSCRTNHNSLYRGKNKQ
jgi:hypothetical protein